MKNKIIDFLRRHTDKLAHIGAGAIISFIFVTIIGYYSMRWGQTVAMAVTIGIAIIWEDIQSNFDMWDVIATVIGGALVVGATQL